LVEIGSVVSEEKNLKIFSSETTGPIATKLWWNDPWMAPFQNCVRCSRLPTKMATKLKIEKGGMKGQRAELPDTFLEENHPMTISSKFCSY
jgi:hypothetical protein